MTDSSEPRTGPSKEDGQELQREGIPFLSVGIFFLVIVAFIVWHRFK
jgi:hypothetical protein